MPASIRARRMASYPQEGMKYAYVQGDIDLRTQRRPGEGEDHLIEGRGVGGQEEESGQ